jgi:hypothetical protein
MQLDLPVEDEESCLYETGIKQEIRNQEALE